MTFLVSLILSDRSTSMLKSFLVVSVLKMEVYECAFSVAIHHEEHGAKLASYSHKFYSQSALGVTFYTPPPRLTPTSVT